MSISKEPVREIIEDFAKELTDNKTEGPKPSTALIDFRSDQSQRNERKVWSVPLYLLRYRKDNGRIASDVMSFERSVGPLNEKDETAQKKLAEFLKNKDPQKNKEVYQLILMDGQTKPAIVTSDGFLIDGNRRRFTLEALQNDHPTDTRFQRMDVVILPGKDDQEAQPTLLEIEKIESKYQLQRDGKAEYYGFDAALSIRRKEEMGFSLEEQLRYDPQYANLPPNKFSAELNSKRKELLDPLDCIDRYLECMGRPGDYVCVSSGIADSEGRWQSFIDYSNFYTNTLQSDSRRGSINVEEDEVGQIENAAWKIIRLRNLRGLIKPHQAMRNLGKYCKHAKKEIVSLSKIPDELTEGQKLDSDGNVYSFEEQEKIWAGAAEEKILKHLSKAIKATETGTDKDTPLELLSASLKKLKHQHMDVSSLAASDYEKARKLASRIQKNANRIEHEIYDAIKRFKELTKK